ncbi:MAG TPA: acetate--CoA ligase family protein [Candidatus Cybelea sp.]|nr:acetate--CoA ligase family protein [Candidatus Cybelea sp.]
MTGPTNRARNLRRLLQPRHVCIVGGQAMEDSIRRCDETGFAGEVWVVNPKRSELGGRKCYSSIADLPEAPDATFIAVPREPTIEILRLLSERGAGGAICYAAGYAEVGGEGVGLQQELIAAVGDLAMVGPNCYGILNYLDGIALWPTGHNGRRVGSGCAFIGQSGNIALNVTANDRSVPFAYVISSGNQVILTVADFVDALTEDPRVTAIGLYIEGIDDVPAFSRAAAKAMRAGKPLVALKAGKSELGAKLAMSHTSSLAGSDRMYDALFERLGVIRVDSIPQLMETIKFVSVAGLPNGNRLAVFTCSGGDGLMTADIAEQIDLPLPQHSADQAADLRQQLPNFATISNPLDYNTSLWGHEDLLTRCFGTVMRGDFDAGMLVIDYATDGETSELAWNASVHSLITACKTHGKLPIVTSTLPELLPARVRDMAIAEGGAPMQGLREALMAFAATERFARLRDRLAGENLNSDRIDSMLLPPSPKPHGAPRLLHEYEAKLQLATYGLAVPESRVVDAAGAAAAAAELGFPVVLKVAEPVLAHKTEAGAVAVNLKSAAEVEAALARMSTALAKYQPGAKIAKVLVERMVGDVIAEMIIGIKRDPQFGLALVVGAGGILVEMVQDSAMLLLPTDRASIERAIDGLKIAKLLKGYRGRPAGDLRAVANAVAAVAAFAEAHRGNLLELDVNPLMVLKTGAVAVDALVVLAEA